MKVYVNKNQFTIQSSNDGRSNQVNVAQSGPDGVLSIHETSDSITITIEYPNNTCISMIQRLDREQTRKNDIISEINSIFVIQFVLTLATILFFNYYKPAAKWAVNYYEVFLIALILLIVDIISRTVCKRICCRPPYNWILMTVVTMIGSYIAATISIIFRTKLLVLSVVYVIGLYFILDLIAYLTKWNFTKFHRQFLAWYCVEILFGICVTINHTNTLCFIYSYCGLLVFSSLYLDNKQKVTGSLKECPLAATSMYIELVMLCLFTHRILVAVYIDGILNGGANFLVTLDS